MQIANRLLRKKGKEIKEESDSAHKGKELAAAARAQVDTSLNGIPTTENNRSLEELYARLAESEEVKEKLRKMFKTLRIMLVGRSGSGKTTIIRLVMGEKGPRNMVVGRAGVQDISVEWHHPDAEVPLVFHDSNGMDVLGAERLEDIMRFLDPNQKNHGGDFCDKVML
jgi:ABC-type glutathione transport system ATPase component